MLSLSSPRAGQVGQPPVIASLLPRFVGCHPSLACPAVCVGLGFPGSSDSIEPAYNTRNLGSIPGSGKSPGEGNGNPLQYSCLENSMDRGAGRATVHGVAKSWTQLSK